ncbi:MAG TPA: hypothetical protein VIR57_08465 [Chloroflexota bacterium]
MEAVEPDPRNIRRGAIDPADVETLRLALHAAVVRGEEFESPISVYPIGAGRFRIKHGHRRFAAAKLEGIRRLHFHIVSQPSERDRILDQLDDNLNAKSISHIDMACALDALRHLGSVEDGAQKELSLRQLVVLLRERGVPGAEKEEAGRAWVRQHLDLLKLHEEVRELVDTGKLGYSLAIKLKDQPLKEQPLLARRIVAEGLSWRDVDVLLGREPHSNGQFSEDDGFDAGATLTAASANSPVEARLLSLVGQIEASAEAANTARRPRGQSDPSRRNSAVELEWEPYSASALPEPVDAKARHDLQQLDSSHWAASASAGALTLAHDLIAWGHREPDDARRLADACMSELMRCPQEYRRLLYSMRMMLDATEPAPPLPSVGLMLRLYLQELSCRLPAA